MAIAYFDTLSGIAGDMTLAALVDAGADAEYIRTQVASLGLHKVRLEFSETERHCFRALRLDVRHPPEHAHRHLSDIRQMFDGSQLTSAERGIADRIFVKLAAAEAKVHGSTIENVHFHEVGAIDSIVDIVGVSVAICNLGIDRIVAAPPPTGCGFIDIAHGRVSVPAPATAELLVGIPTRASSIEAELVTPTGAAILATLADAFGPAPSMRTRAIGYGAGHRELPEQANILRVLVGETVADSSNTDGCAPSFPPHSDQVVLLETNLDDMSGEQIGFAIERLWEAKALDVYTTAIAMKKGRPGVLLSAICRPERRDAIEECLLAHTSTLGIRRRALLRRTVRRQLITVPTRLGTARVKLAWLDSDSGIANGSRGFRVAPEYEDCRRLALANALRIERVFQIVLEDSQQAVQQAAEKEESDAKVASESDSSQVLPEHHDPHAHDPHDHDPHDHHDHHHH